jgi:hypothetical protein
MINSYLGTKKLDGEVLRDQMAIGEHDDEVELELYLECPRGGCWTREQAREYHVDRNRKTTSNITVSNLNVLDLGRCASCKAYKGA